MNDLREEMLLVLEERFGIERASVSDTSRLQEDLDLDSIDLFDIIGIIEQKTGTNAELTDFLGARTFGDFLRTLEGLLAKAPAA